ncbi:HAD family hydrolase [Brucella haematophila]|uniref:Haloacid dehalogenase-like hydrolase n=1 Tax=Brucella haematophila TaxID=419474 RepID=A0ABX1DQK8_9HYPH|nr:HAD family hydrolase [Brucella haematophila]NKC05232.1 haloacid dehalogenase-like hydrolase [Brucella haematophila]TMV02505.1 haloacid dehalogenase-like hydrolase [Brucella haematophila]
MRSLARLVLIVTLQISTSAWAAELSNWNDSKSRQQIVDFVEKVTKQGSRDYVAPADRIAVFDNDGTLWTEQPYYFQLAFMLDRVKALAPDHPEWNTTEPFKSILNDDLAGIAKSGEKGVVELGMATHAGMTTDEFNKIVTDWYATAKHPKTGKPFTEMTFLPMRELLDYLRAHDFKTFIVSGGGVEFMRPMTEKAYGIPAEQVIGSSIKTQYAVENDQPVLKRLPEVDFIDDGPGKPVGINRAIGKKPIFIAGNSDGDYEMLRWGTASPNSLGIIIHHTDGDREYAYDRQSSFGKLDKALTEAPKRNWVIVDMKNDWKKVYAFE